MFLGNMLMPSETHIIRLGSDTLDASKITDSILAKRPELYQESFQLTSCGAVVEDELSAIGFVDLDPKRPIGISQPRLFVYTERNKRGANMSFTALDEILEAVFGKFVLPRGAFFTLWGVIREIHNMNIVEDEYQFALSLFGLAAFTSDRVVVSKYTKDFVRFLEMKGEGLSFDGVDMEGLLPEDAASALIGNLHFGLLQVAYANAVIENQE